MSGWHPKWMKMYADLIGNYKKQRIKSLCGNTVSWANQTRMLAQNFEKLGSVIGSGLIAWLRPAIVAINNAMDSIIAAVQRVVNALGKIFGWQMIIDTTGGVIEDAEGMADAYDDATGAAKKFKQQLLGIDELNNLTTNDKGSGSGDSGGYGFGGTNIIQPGGIDFVPFESDIDTLYKLGEKLSEGLRNLLPDDWTPIYEKMRGFGTGLADFLNGLISPETFYKVGQSIAGAINSLGEFLLGFIENADWKKYKDSFISLLDGFFGEIKLKNVAIIIGAITISKVLKWVLSGAALKGLASAIGTAISGIFSGGAGGGFLSGITAALGGMSTAALVAVGAVAALVAGLAVVFATNEDVRKSFMEAVTTIKDALSPAIEFIANTIVPNLVSGFMGLLDILSPLGEFISGVFVSIWQDMLNPALKSIGENILPPLIEVLERLWTQILVPLGTLLGSVLKPVIELLASVLTNLWHNVVVPIAQGIGSIVVSAIQMCIGIINDLIAIFSPLIEVITALWETTLKPVVNWLVGTLKPIVDTVFTFIKDMINSVADVLSGLINFITGVFTLNWEKAWSGVASVFKGIFNAMIGFLEGTVNLVIDLLNGLFSGINKLIGSVGNKIGLDIAIPLIEHFHVERFEFGGFPDQGSLFVAGETYGQSEWVGNINGRTGVASGKEITGIADAIYQTSAQEMEIMRSQNQYLYEILQKEFGISQKEVGQAARTYAKEFYDRTGKSAYQF